MLRRIWPRRDQKYEVLVYPPGWYRVLSTRQGQKQHNEFAAMTRDLTQLLLNARYMMYSVVNRRDVVSRHQKRTRTSVRSLSCAKTSAMNRTSCAPSRILSVLLKSSGAITLKTGRSRPNVGNSCTHDINSVVVELKEPSLALARTIDDL